MLWLWRRPVATAPIQPLAWEPPYAAGAAQEIATTTTTTTKDKKTKKTKKKYIVNNDFYNQPTLTSKYLPKTAEWIHRQKK